MIMEREFQDKVVIITGGAQGIGKCIADLFEEAGAHVCVIDKQPGNHYVGDIADKEVLESFARKVIDQYGQVDVIVNNALPLMKGLDECSYEEFQYAMNVGLCSEKAGFITGENICIDGGMTRQMIYHGEYGWNYSNKDNE